MARSRRVKSDKGDAWALAVMLRTGWFTSAHVESVDSHRLKTVLGARDQLVKVKPRSAIRCAGPCVRSASSFGRLVLRNLR